MNLEAELRARRRWRRALTPLIVAPLVLLPAAAVLAGPAVSPAQAAAVGGYQMAFQANTGVLISYGDAERVNTTQGMMPGTSPSITRLAGGGYQMAFQSNTGYLISFGDAGNVNTRQGMMAGTSPAIAASPDGGYRIAFQANVGRLFTYSSSGGPADTTQGMKAGTNPAIAALATGGYQMAFQANTGYLISYGNAGNVNTRQGMMAGTSPAIAASPAGGYRIAFQANVGRLFTYSSTGGPADTTQGMKAGTNPAIAALATGTLLTPPNLGAPDGNGYYRLPDSQPAGLYTPLSSCRRGSLELIQAIYTVAQRWHGPHPTSPVKVNDLNGPNPPHVSHANGVDVDISVGDLTTSQRIELGRLFIDTAIIKLILYSGPDFATVSGSVNQYAGAETMVFYSDHDTHYHVRILDAYRGPFSRDCT